MILKHTQIKDYGVSRRSILDKVPHFDVCMSMPAIRHYAHTIGGCFTTSPQATFSTCIYGVIYIDHGMYIYIFL